MMVSPNFYREECSSLSLDKLKLKRDELLKDIKNYEDNKIPEDEMFVKPSPETRYKMNNEYLKEILELIIIQIKKK